mgnify:CR=1 FL=1
MKLLQLFFDFLKIGLFSIGGGYAIIPAIKEQVVITRGWISLQEFSDIITISQMTPGPLAVNTSTFVGMRVHGISGALTATIGCILMGVLITVGLYKLFSKYSYSQYFKEMLKGLKSASLGLIASAAAIILTLAFFNSETIDFSTLQISSVLICIFALIAVRKTKLNPILIMILCGIMNLFTLI